MHARMGFAVGAVLGICLLTATGCASGSQGSQAAGGPGSASVSPTPTPTPTETELTGAELAAALPALTAYGTGMVESQNYPQNSGGAIDPTDNMLVGNETCWQLVNAGIGATSDSYAFDGVQQATSDPVGPGLTVTFSLTQFAAGTGAQTFSAYTSGLGNCTTLSQGIESGTVTTAPLAGLGDHAQSTETTVTDTVTVPGIGAQKSAPKYTRIVDVIYGDVEIEATAESSTRSSAEDYNLVGLVQLTATKLSLK